MSVINKINYLSDTKQLIKQSIINKGVDISEAESFSSYPSKIASISQETPEPLIFTSIENPSISSAYDFEKSLFKDINLLDVDTEFSTMKSMFYMYQGLEKVIWPVNIDTSNVTSMEQMFFQCHNLKNMDLGKFDTSKLTTTYSMFEGCKALSSINFGSNWFCQNVTSMQSMFYGCSSLTTLDLFSVKTLKLTNVANMFYGCTSLVDVTWPDAWLANSAVTEFSLSDSPISHDSCLKLFNRIQQRPLVPSILSLSETTKSYMSDEEIAVATNKGWTVA